jgi:hypothetical protein
MNRRFFFGALALSTILALSVSIAPVFFADSGANHQDRNLNFGVSGGNVNDISRRFCCSGTLGSLVKDNTGALYILSNNHVLGLAGNASAGDDISQPGLIDNNCQVATVVADFTTAPPLSAGVDCAIAALRAGQMDGGGAIQDIGTISSLVKAPSVGLGVAKSGRTTGFTTGTVGSINTTVSVRYPKSCGGGGGPTFTFPNQVVINSSTFSAGGDSGSLIVTNNACHQPVALLFAGSSSATIGNPVGAVLTALSNSLGSPVSFVGGTCSALAFEETAALPQTAIDRAMVAKERNENKIMAKASVMGIGISVADDATDEAVIVVYVDQTTGKRPKLPKTLDGLRVKVVYTDPFVAY